MTAAEERGMYVVTNEVPDPPYPTDIKCNGWSPMFDIARIDTSETWTLAEDEERPWLLRVWYEAWRSVPVGSMPADRRLFARRIGCKAAFLDAHAEILLRGWVLHSDGNLYHPVISDMVLEMLDKRRSAAERQRRYREGVTRDKVDVTRESHEVTRESRLGREGNGIEGKGMEEKEKTGRTSTRAGARFTPPTVEEVLAFTQEQELSVDAQRFVDFYASKGWMVGRNKMKDWKAAARNWARSSAGEASHTEKLRSGDF